MRRPYIVTCKYCGKKLNVSDKKKKYHFSCHPKLSKRRKKRKYIRDFQQAKLLVQIRDCLTCQKCNKHLGNCGRRQPTHHIDGNPLNNDLKNLVLLCESCHKIIHKNGLEKFVVKDFTEKKHNKQKSKRNKLMFKGI